jgi:hypothetical protein
MSKPSSAHTTKSKTEASGKKVSPPVKMSAPAEIPGAKISHADVEMTAETYPIVLTETFNADLLTKCIYHPDVWEADKAALRQYLSASKPLEGSRRQIRVRYDYAAVHRKAKKGRVYAPFTPYKALQGMWNKVRNLIAGEYYWDLDMVNAQPTLMRQIAAGKGWSSPLLNQYCAGRDAILADTQAHYGVDRDTAKELYIRLLYGGGEKNWRLDYKIADSVAIFPFADALSTEMATLGRLIVLDYPAIMKQAVKSLRAKGKEESDYNVRNSTVSLLMQDEENRCLQAAKGYLSTQGRPMTCEIFDGGHIAKLLGESECPAALLAGIMEAVKVATGYDTIWISKPMVSDLDVSEVVVGDDTMESLTGEIDDLFAARTFVKLMGDHIARDDDMILCFNPLNGMWEHNDKALMSAAIRHAAELVFTETLVDASGKVKEKKHNYGGDVGNMMKMLKLVPMLVPDTRFIERNGDSSMYKMLFRDGIYDFRTGEFTEGFDPAIVFFASIPRAFPRERSEALISEIHDCLFVKPFISDDDPHNDMGNFYLQYLARSIVGEYHHKKLLIGVGNRNTGKGVTTDAMTATFAGYVSTYDANNMLTNRVSKDESQKLMWLKPLRTSRLMMANEVDILPAEEGGGGKKAATRCINGNLINRLAGGGDVITFRGIAEEDIKVRWRTNVVMLANDMAPIAPVNEGVLERVRNMRWAKSFKMLTAGETLAPNELPADPKWRTIFRTDEAYQNAFFWVIADAFSAIKDEAFFDPELVKSETKEWVGEAGSVRIRETLETDYIITKDANDKVAFDELARHLKDNGIGGLSATKLGRELTALGLTQIKAWRNPDTHKVVAARSGIRARTADDPDPAAPANGGAGHIPGEM